MKKKLKSWEIKIGNKLWLVLAEKKPTIKPSKIKGLEFNSVIVDETINGAELKKLIKTKHL